MREHDLMLPEPQRRDARAQIQHGGKIEAIGNDVDAFRIEPCGACKVLTPNLRHRNMQRRRHRLTPADMGVMRIHRRHIMHPVDPAEVRHRRRQRGEFPRPFQIKGHGEDIVNDHHRSAADGV